MKSNTRKKILALFAAATLGVAGVAWAAIASGVISTTASGAIADFNTGADTTDPDRQFVLNSATTDLKGTTILPVSDDARITATGRVTAATILAYTSFDITVGEGEHFTIQPTRSTAPHEAVTWGNLTTPGVLTITADPAGALQAVASQANSGDLRLTGEGTTTIYAARSNAPTTTDAFNTYSGGTLLKQGRLEIAHSNAIGLGGLYVNREATVAFIDTDIELGNKSPGPSVIDLSQSQQIALLRSDDKEIDKPLPVYFDVTAATTSGTPLTFVANSRILENVNNHGATNWRNNLNLASGTPTNPTAANLTGVQLVKQGPGKMTIRQDGAWHTAGTVVEEGTLDARQIAGLSDRFVGEIGNTWGATPDENVSARSNYDRTLTNAPSPAAWYNNNLVVNEGAIVDVNRDQFFANFDGAGAFNAYYWTKAQQNQIIQVTVQLSDQYRTDTASSFENPAWGYDSTYSGPITGPLRLVLDNPVTWRTAANVTRNDRVTETYTNLTRADQPYLFTYGRPRMLSLTGANNITDGDTTIKDGILSINKAEGTLPPGEIRVGLNNRGMIHNNAGVSTGTTSFRGFLPTSVDATLHAKETFPVAQPTIVMVNDDGIVPGTTISADIRAGFANLAANTGRTMSFSDITLHADMKTDLVTPTVPTNKGIMLTNAVRINDQFGGYYSNWNGTIAFTDKYDFPGTDGGNRLGIRVRAGKLHLDKVQESGAALVAIEEGAILSLGNEARNFTGNGENNKLMDVYVQDDSRIDVVIQPTDLYATQMEAVGTQGEPAIFRANKIDYEGLGTGDANKDKRLVIGVDVAKVSTSLFGKWIPLVNSVAAPHWNYTHYLREYSDGQKEDKHKIVVAYVNSNGDAVDINADNYEIVLDERTHTILVNIKQIDVPVSTGLSATFANLNTEIVGLATYHDSNNDPVVSEDMTAYLFHEGVDTTVLTNAIQTLTLDPTDSKGQTAFRFTGLTANTTYQVKLVAADGTEKIYQTKTSGGTTPISSGSSSGCDAGFGAFALLAMAGGALVLRKKD